MSEQGGLTRALYAHIDRSPRSNGPWMICETAKPVSGVIPSAAGRVSGVIAIAVGRIVGRSTIRKTGGMGRAEITAGGGWVVENTAGGGRATFSSVSGYPEALEAVATALPIMVEPSGELHYHDRFDPPGRTGARRGRAGLRAILETA